MKLIAVSNAQLKKHQRKIFIGLIGILVVIGTSLFFFGLEKPSVPQDTINEKAPIYDVTQALDDKSFWVFKSEQRLSEQEKKQEKLNDEIEEVRASFKKSIEEDTKSQIESLQNQITALEQQLNVSNTQNDITQDEPLDGENFDSQPLIFEGSRQNLDIPFNAKPTQTSSIFSETVVSINSRPEKPRPHHDHYIPAGSYAKAVLLSGVDVSVGVSSQTNPQPVLLRLIHRGSLPNKFFGKIRDCRIIAAASGELSSERAQFRLEKLSCIEPDGRVIETDVDGYISGEDGKNGMRGRLVMRDIEVLKRGFLGGLLSGLGKATSQSFNTTSVSPFGAVSTVKNGDIFKQAGSEGAGNAFELMARYNIQRAEQYQPVIQVSAGREVTVIFHSGRAFGEERAKAPLKTSDSKLDTFFGDNS